MSPQAGGIAGSEPRAPTGHRAAVSASVPVWSICSPARIGVLLEIRGNGETKSLGERHSGQYKCLTAFQALKASGPTTDCCYTTFLLAWHVVRSREHPLSSRGTTSTSLPLILRRDRQGIDTLLRHVATPFPCSGHSLDLHC